MSFFDFLNSYLMPQEKSLTKLRNTAKNGILISNAFFITIETNKNNNIIRTTLTAQNRFSYTMVYHCFQI